MNISIYLDGSKSINSNDNEQIVYSCVNTIWLWLFLHLCYTCFVTVYVLLPPTLLLDRIIDYLWTWHSYDHESIEDFSIYERDESRFARFRRCVLHEVQLMIVYVAAVFVFTLMMNNRSVHWITIFRWMIEASYIPHIFVFLFVSDYLGIGDEFYSVEFDIVFASPLSYMLKGSLFVWMRYTELYPSSRLNDYQTYFFYYHCNALNYHHIPDDHLLRRWLHPL